MSHVDTERLNQWKNVHPRILTDVPAMEKLKDRVKRDEKYKGLLDSVRAYADEQMEAGPTPYTWTEGEHEGWQVKATRQMPSFAACYALTGEKRYLDAAVRWAAASCSYPTWGKEVVLNSDLCASTQMLGLSIVYDWCYRDLDAGTRELIKTTLRKRGEDLYHSACFETQVFWKNYWLQNHLWIDVCALAVVSATLFDEYPETVKWLERAMDILEKITDVLGNDGASQEGYMYWEYGLEWLFKFLDIARKFAGFDKYDTPWFQNTVEYGIQLLLPTNAWTVEENIVNFGDCDRRMGGFYGSGGLEQIMRKLAAEYRNPHAQWLADVVREKHLDVGQSNWLSLLWYDDTVKPVPSKSLAALAHFQNMGIVTARSDWSGDESLLSVRCGPDIGHKAHRLNQSDPFEDWGGGHVHPDVNHINLFGCGEWLLRDDGYSFKLTSNHSTLLIDGKGQAGENEVWFSSEKAYREGGCPAILSAKEDGGAVHVACDGTGAYPKAANLKKFIRHLVYLKPNILFVVDEVETAEDCALELRFIPEGQTCAEDGRNIVFTGKKAKLQFTQLSAGADFGVEKVPIYEGREMAFSNCLNAPEERRIISIKNHGPVRWLNIASFTWGKKEQALPATSLDVQDGSLRLSAGEKSYRLSLEGVGPDSVKAI